MGLFEARSFAELIILPGLARVETFTGARPVPMYSKIGLLVSYSGVVVALAYYYLYRWRWWLLLPMIGVLLLGMAQAGRAGTIIVLLQVLITVYLKNVIELKRSAARAIVNCTALPVVLMVAIFLGGQLFREGWRSAGSDDILRVIYSLRSYLFGGVSAFSYWINNFYDVGVLTLGKYSFSSLFNALGIAAQEPGVYDQYLPIASNGDVTNLYTAYRSFIEDFSLYGACIVYFLSGIAIAAVMRNFVKGKRVLVPLLIPLLSWLAFSPMYSATYFNSFLLSCVLPYFLVRRASRGQDGHNQRRLRELQ
jgi:oligosaccharide repeat unit polymerase